VIQEVKYAEGMPVSGTVDGLVAALFHEENAVGAHTAAWELIVASQMMCLT
jgi:hypothetical protein